MTEPLPFDLDQVLAPLKDFQRRTVDRVHERLWDEQDPARRFLVADEVGLGKTLVARGIVARTIDMLWDGPRKVDRIDVVYICSNAQIARQNLPKLRLGDGGDAGTLTAADRLTMLATKIESLGDRRINLVSFTPGTSFDIGRSGGRAPERVLLYWLLRSSHQITWARKWLLFFRGMSGLARFKNAVEHFDRSEIAPALAESYGSELKDALGPEGGPLLDELVACADVFDHRPTDWSPDYTTSRRRYRLIGALRHLLARTAVRALEPDLVILDEFQRFKDLLDDANDDEGAELARELFGTPRARVVLLSATPYKMYTLPEEREQEGDDHYRDFLATVRFLGGQATAEPVEEALSAMRAALYADDRAAAKDAKDRVEGHLRRVMVRTERLASTPERDGMVSERQWTGVTLAPADVKDYRRLARTSRVVGGFDPLEFWRSSPYVLELMDGYKLKKQLETHAQDPGDHTMLVDAVAAGGTALQWQDVDAYRRLDPGNAKMRGLVDDVVERGAWQLAWIPPSCPYYDPAGPYADPALQTFTKRLIFSAWAVVPKAVGTVLSYEAERRLMEANPAEANRTYSGRRQRPLLTFVVNREGRRSGMPVLGLLYPSVVLAEVGDPLRVARELRATLPLRRESLLDLVRDQVAALLADLPPGPVDGVVDEAWYWAAPMLLDHSVRSDEPPSVFRYGTTWGPDEGSEADETRFADHLTEADQMVAGGGHTLGRRPDDLADVLAAVAVAGPGVTALRALSRVAGGPSFLADHAVRDAASNVAWSLRNHMNSPEMIAVVRRAARHGEGAYWRDVLGHCLDGGLQSVLDEYVHVLDEGRGGAIEPLPDKLARITAELDAALSLRTASNTFTQLTVAGRRLQLDTETDGAQHRIRTSFAVRFGRATTDDQAQVREGEVRTAYNSPFWPFVLCSTSVGQEGLDFHWYSHAVVHWNLPANPVDLEQREGRVHRYKGHAVRKNVAAKYGARLEVLDAEDPWETLFELAAAERPDGETEVYPYWVFPLPGGAVIERYVPALPLSSETRHYKRLLRTVGAYRLVVGQPRQEDLLEYLGERAEEMTDLRIDLSP